jgi:hypothetical protein
VTLFDNKTGRVELEGRPPKPDLATEERVTEKTPDPVGRGRTVAAEEKLIEKVE